MGRGTAIVRMVSGDFEMNLRRGTAAAGRLLGQITGNVVQGPEMRGFTGTLALSSTAVFVISLFDFGKQDSL